MTEWEAIEHAKALENYCTDMVLGCTVCPFYNEEEVPRSCILAHSIPLKWDLPNDITDAEWFCTNEKKMKRDWGLSGEEE